MGCTSSKPNVVMTRPNTARFATNDVPSWAAEGAQLPVEERYPDIKQGWLSKQGGDASSAAFTNWKKRYFVLELGVLTYYETQAENHPCKKPQFFFTYSTDKLKPFLY